MRVIQKTRRQLERENRALRVRLGEAEDTLYAIRSGEVDAIIVSGPSDEQVFTLKGADYTYRILIETINEGAVTMTPEGTILYSNHRLADLVATPLDQTIGSAFQRFVAPADRLTFEALLEQGRRDSSSGEVMLQTGDGKYVPVLLSTRAMEIDTLRAICMVVTDISQQKRVEEDLRRMAEELMRSNVELEQLAYVASHDLQEPLRMVTSFVQLLQRRYQGQIDVKADKWITYVVDGTVRMQQLIDDLLLFLWTGRHQFMFAPTDCEEVLQTVLANLKLSLTRQGATVTHDRLPIILADELQIARLFQNLIGNAVKFHSTAPLHIHVSAKPQGTAWVFSVCDNGIGIEPQYAERVFEIFQCLHTHDEYPGTGIGLAICKKIVERHGGRIWVESELGQGATFRFVLRAPEASHHGQE